MKLLSQTIKQLFTFIIVFQMAVPAHLFANTSPNNPNDVASEGTEESRIYAEALSNPDARKEVALIEQTADAIEKGTFQIDTTKLLSFYMPDQFVVLYKRNQPSAPIKLDELNAPLNIRGYSTLRPGVDPETQSLFIEALIGVKADGTGGELVARQYIPNLKVSSFSFDNEMLVVLDKNGNLNVTDWGFIKEQVFNNHLPVIPKVWEQKDVNHPITKTPSIKMEPYTRGMKPFVESDFDVNAVIPRDEKNRIDITAGDFVVSYVDDFNQSRIYGVFKRKTLYSDLQSGALFILEQIVAHRPSKDFAAVYESVRKYLDLYKEKIKNFETQDADPLIEQFFRRAGSEYLDSLKRRSSEIQSYSERELDKVEFRKMNQAFEELVRSYSTKSGVSVEELSEDDFQKLSKNWQDYVEVEKHENPLAKTPFQKLSQSVGKYLGFKTLVAAVAVVGTSYLALPFGMDYVNQTQSANQFTVLLTWAYENLYFPVLKDANYRGYLYLSSFSLLAFMPAAYFASMAAKKMVQLGNSLAKVSDSHTAIMMRELASTWINMGTFQRIISFTLRIYAKLIYPAVRLTVEKILMQKTFINAVNTGVNPLRRVSKDSVVGRTVGLEKDIRPGVNFPIQSQQDKTFREKTVVAVAQQQERASNLAWKIATMVVAAKNQVDPVTLSMIINGQISTSELSKITSDERLMREWHILGEKLYSEISSEDLTQLDFDKIDYNKVLEYSKVAELKLADLQKQKNIHLELTELRFKAQAISKKVALFMLTNGFKESKFLSSIKANEFVTKQTEKGFVMDYIPTVGTMALVGARADFVRPEYLAADPAGVLWTRTAHLSDTLYQVYIHLVVSGARKALVYQSGALKGTEEENYRRVEELKLVPNERPEPFLEGLTGWLNSLHPLNGVSESRIQAGYVEHANISHYSWKGFVRRYSTLQAALLTSIFTSYYMMNSDPSSTEKFTLAQSFGSFILGFFAAQWFFGWIWDFVDRLSNLDGTRLDALKLQLREAQIKIQKGLNEEDSRAAKEMIEEGYRELLGLYSKHNKAAFSGISFTIKKTEYGELFDALAVQSKSLNHSEKEYIGIISDIIFKLNEKKYESAEKSAELLRQHLAENGSVDMLALDKLNAQGLLKLSLANPPVYTTPNKIISWLAVFGAGILTTYMGTELFVKMYDPNFLTTDYILPWMLKCYVYFGLWALAFDVNSWKAYYKIYQSPKQFITMLREKVDGQLRNRSQIKDHEAVLAGASCRALFAGI